jgi:hypothetical protein
VPFLPVDGRVNILAFLYILTNKKGIDGANDPNQYWRLFSFGLFLASPINPAFRITPFSSAINPRKPKTPRRLIGCLSGDSSA